MINGVARYVKKNKVLFAICLASLLFYLPSFFSFFAADDWFHLRIIQISNLTEFFNFFAFMQGPQSAGSYRPLATQLYFFLHYSLFGLNPIPYHLTNTVLFCLNIFLVYYIAYDLIKDTNKSLLAAFFYGFSATHFTKMYFISAFQETLMVFLVLSSLTLFIKKDTWKTYYGSILCFILALCSKETAAVIPLSIFLYSYVKRDLNVKRLTPYFLILLVYIYLRFIVFGKIEGESYIWDFSLKKLLNTIMWYTLWSFGSPELLVDYVSSGLKILPRFYSDFPVYSYLILISLFTTLASFIVLIIRRAKDIFNINTALMLVLFLISLGPVLFLPWHKFTLELTLPLVWFSIFMANLYKGKIRYLYIAFMVCFFILNVLTIHLTYRTHYSVSRSIASYKIYTYMRSYYPHQPDAQNIVFVNSQDKSGPKSEAQELSYVTSGSDLFKVLYKNKDYKVYFEGTYIMNTTQGDLIKIDALQFLKRY
jgi:hypothetical protein